MLGLGPRDTVNCVRVSEIIDEYVACVYRPSRLSSLRIYYHPYGYIYAAYEKCLYCKYLTPCLYAGNIIHTNILTKSFRLIRRHHHCVPCETAIITSGRGEHGKWSVAHGAVEGAALGLCPGAWTFFISFFLPFIRRRRRRRHSRHAQSTAVRALPSAAIR